MESINRSEYDLSYRVKINVDTVLKCIEEVNEDIGNRNSFYSDCVLKRFDKCNENYLREFDESLDELYDSMFSDNSSFDYYQFKKLLKSSTKLTSSVYNKYVDLICSLN